jgi:hypothetical protein
MRLAINAHVSRRTRGRGRYGLSSTSRSAVGISPLIPTLDRSWHGPGVHQGVTFSPNIKAGYDFTRKLNAGIEYYGAYGDLSGFDTLRDQQQQFFFATNLNVSPKWEFNFGIGVGATRSTDHLLLKAIVGGRFSWGHGGYAEYVKRRQAGRQE